MHGGQNAITEASLGCTTGALPHLPKHRKAHLHAEHTLCAVPHVGEEEAYFAWLLMHTAAHYETHLEHREAKLTTAVIWQR